MLKFLYLISLNESTIFFVKIINKIIALIANIVMPLIYKLFYKTIGTNDNNDKKNINDKALNNLLKYYNNNFKSYSNE